MGLPSAQARNSLHAPSNADEEDELLIYNYQPHFTGKHSYSGEEVWLYSYLVSTLRA